MNYDVVVIGGGVIGCAVARELTKYNTKVALLERDEDMCTGTSKANSAIMHAGFDAKPESMMAKMNVLGNSMMTELAKELDIPFDRCGALVLCFDENDIPKLHDLYDRGVKNGVPNLKVLSKEECHAIESNLSDEVCAALYAPTSGIVCPFEMTVAFGENAAVNGAEFFFENEVTNITKTGELYEITTPNATFTAKAVVNCAGVYADKIHNMVCDDKMEIIPRKGEYLLCDKEVGTIVSKTLFQLPTALGKGILVSPTVHGNLLLGPTAQNIDDKEDLTTTADGMQTVLDKARISIKNVPSRNVITSFTGLRAHTEAEDFIISESTSPLFFDVAGIESPGLSSAPAIGEYTAKLVADKLDLSENKDFISTRKGTIKAEHLSFDDRKSLIESMPEYGQIICRCEMISEGEILSAIHRPLGARTLDGIKRRVRVGLGRCQGGFCTPKVMEILSRELNMPYKDLRKNDKNSYLVVGRTQKGGDTDE